MQSILEAHKVVDPSVLKFMGKRETEEDFELLQYIGSVDNPIERSIASFVTETSQDLFYLQEAGLEPAIQMEYEVPDTDGLSDHLTSVLQLWNMRELSHLFGGKGLSRTWRFDTPDHTGYRNLDISKDSLRLELQDNVLEERVVINWELPTEHIFTRMNIHYLNFKNYKNSFMPSQGSIDMFYDRYKQGFQVVSRLNEYPFYEHDANTGIRFDNHILGGSFNPAGNQISIIPKERSQPF